MPLVAETPKADAPAWLAPARAAARLALPSRKAKRASSTAAAGERAPE